MRFLVDAQLPPALGAWLRERVDQAEHVTERLSGQTPDRVVAAYAAEHDLVLLTKDDDFALRHSPVDYQLVWLRCGNIGNVALRAWLEPRWPELIEELRSGGRMVELH